MDFAVLCTLHLCKGNTVVLLLNLKAQVWQLIFAESAHGAV